MNSLKSACSFAKSAPVPFDELQQDLEPLLGFQIRVKLIVRLISILEAAELLNHAIHREPIYHATCVDP
ncbi:MAG TPA: hypothetical protein VM166_00080 [Gemmatimonadaceae bacterium]|nr:hypothetical protein [Gemmatimonadaceae bacterium]